MESSAAFNAMPSAVADFASDPRIHFNTVSGKWEIGDDDGNEMEWDPTKNTWIPLVDDELVRQQQAIYSVEGVDENTPAAPVAAREQKKRKVKDSNGDIDASNGPPKKKRGKDEARPVQSKNTAVFVSHLPLDATMEEIADRFGKFGVIMEDETGEPRIKMYADDQGNFMGEALVVYFMEDSVPLSINLLDEAELRIGEAGSIMRVRKGEFGHKKTDGQTGDAAPRRVVDKKKATQRIIKMKNKVGDWDFEDGFGPTEEPEEKEVAIESRVVVLKHVFTLEELRAEPELLLDLKEDIREEAETIGDVTNVVLYDEEEDGVMTIKFRDPISAKACILKMNGRWFGGRKLEASYYTGKERFRKSGAGPAMGDSEDDGGEKSRLEGFEKWLMAEGER